jgi:hypothetical protein
VPPQALVGQPLRSFINVFSEWAAKFGEDTSLLTLLATRALEGTNESWRVGVRAPGAGNAADTDRADTAGGGGSLLAALRRRDRERPALMQFLVSVHGADAAGGRGSSTGGEDGGEDAAPSLQVVLWRADALVSLLELDGSLAVASADAAAGVLLCCGSKGLVKRDFRR